jgi:hypothetical protein
VLREDVIYPSAIGATVGGILGGFEGVVVDLASRAARFPAIPGTAFG